MVLSKDLSAVSDLDVLILLILASAFNYRSECASLSLHAVQVSFASSVSIIRRDRQFMSERYSNFTRTCKPAR